MSNEKTVFVHMTSEQAATLEGLAGPVVGKRFALSAGTFVIGRESDADLSLPDDTGLSRVHAKIIADVDRYKIVDNDSRNGTLVNDKPIRSVHLFDGDIVRVGSSTLRFSQASAKRPPEPTAIYRPENDASRAPPGPTDPIPVARAPAAFPAWIAAVAGAVVVVVVLIGVAVGIFIGRGSATEADPVAAAATPTPTPTPSPAPTPTPTLASATAAADPAAPPAGASQTPQADVPWSNARFVAAAEEVVRIKSGGKVESVAVKDGDVVDKGEKIAVIAGVTASAADIATRKESISALESVAESNPRAATALAEEKAELQKLLAQTAQMPIVAPAAGTVHQLVLRVGDTVRGGQVVARIAAGAARVEVDGVTAAAGATCELQMKDGSTMKGMAREQKDKTLIVEASGDAKDVVKARCQPSP